MQLCICILEYQAVVRIQRIDRLPSALRKDRRGHGRQPLADREVPTDRRFEFPISDPEGKGFKVIEHGMVVVRV